MNYLNRINNPFVFGEKDYFFLFLSFLAWSVRAVITSFHPFFLFLLSFPPPLFFPLPCISRNYEQVIEPCKQQRETATVIIELGVATKG